MSIKIAAGRESLCIAQCHDTDFECPLVSFGDSTHIEDLDESTQSQAVRYACNAVQKALAKLKEVESYFTKDQLTGLYNRAYAELVLLSKIDYMLAEFDVGNKSSIGIQLAFLDLDGFKAVNDAAGHAAGDQVLRDVADRLRAVTRDHDFVCRWAGDEFIVVAPVIPRDEVIDTEDGMNFGERLVDAVTYDYDNKYRISASVGVVQLHNHRNILLNTTHIEDMINKADREMYRAKGAGKGRSSTTYIELS